jgi:hypothetical protein
MEKPTHHHLRTPTVGQVLNKIMDINPELSPQEMAEIMKQAIVKRGGYFHDGFAKQDVIDEAIACDLARKTLQN